MPSNKAAWLKAVKATPLEIQDAPYNSPRDNEIVVKNAAVAINPVDRFIQTLGNSLSFTWLKYPFILGCDVAGEVVEVGRSVKRFQVGDRVVGHAVGMDEKYNTSSQGAFQLYTVLQTQMASPIPNMLSYKDACVIPLGASTAACGLFQKDQLALDLPTLPRPQPKGKTLIIWGGSTSVGCNAIQLAVAAGYEVITTASPRNFDLIKKLGASQAFDYNSKTVKEDIIRAMKGKTVAGAMSIGNGAADACHHILHHCNGDKFLSMITYPLPDPSPTSFVLPRTIVHFLSWNISNWFKSKWTGVRNEFVFGSSLVDNGVGKAIYEDFLPQALAQDLYLCAPEPMVVGNGLEHIQEAFDILKHGISAKKLVVTL